VAALTSLGTLTGLQLLAAGASAAVAGAVNALAGGGTLITFPTLLALGLPPVVANVTNTVALSPAYLGATLAQKDDLRGQSRRVWSTLLPAAIGGALGGGLLLNTGEGAFRVLVPFLILLASGLLAIQEPLRRWLLRRARDSKGGTSGGRWVALLLGLAAVYGGYFGAGLSVIILAVLALLIEETLTRLNALKQFLASIVNIAAALLFLFSGRVDGPLALVMAGGALIGGLAGGRLAGRVRPAALRWSVVAIGLVAGVGYLVRA
jgi:uncharacterized membrane protein YfcA